MSLSGLASVVFVYKSAVKMMAVLLNFIVIGPQAVILWVGEGGGWSQKVLQYLKFIGKILVQYGEHCMTWKNICKCVDRLKCQGTTHDEEQSCWPSTSPHYA
jgi:hypothetical protein